MKFAQVKLSKRFLHNLAYDLRKKGQRTNLNLKGFFPEYSDIRLQILQENTDSDRSNYLFTIYYVIPCFSAGYWGLLVVVMNWKLTFA